MMLDHHGYTGHSIWVADLVEYTGRKIKLPTAVSGLLTLGSIPYILTGIFFFLANGPESLNVVVIQILAATIASIGPIFIWHYDENVFPTFVEEVNSVVTDEESLITVINKYEKFFQSDYWLLTVAWTFLILAALITNIRFFETLGVSGMFDPAFLTYIIFAIWWSVLTGIGLHGALTTILCVRAVGDLEITIDPLHHDGLGGLSTIGYFSIRATLMNSIGSFGFPLAFAIADRGGYRPIVYVAVGAYVIFIILSFVYPTLYVNRRAQEVRERILQEKREKIQKLKNQSQVGSTGGELSELESQLKIRTLRDDFHEYQNVNLYPLSIVILTRLVSSILLPIGFTLLETYVFTS
jgi:hypothetical protein